MQTMRSKRAAAALALAVALAGLGLLSGAAQAKFQKAIWGPYYLPAGNDRCPTPGAPARRSPSTRNSASKWSSSRSTGTKSPPPARATLATPSDPAYHWGPIDEFVNGAQGYPLELAAMLTGSPGWANGGRPSIWAPKNPKDFANFAYAAAKRYPFIHSG